MLLKYRLVRKIAIVTIGVAIKMPISRWRATMSPLLLEFKGKLEQNILLNLFTTVDIDQQSKQNF
jgi:hypothetical protein